MRAKAVNFGAGRPLSRPRADLDGSGRAHGRHPGRGGVNAANRSAVVRRLSRAPSACIGKRRCRNTTRSGGAARQQAGAHRLRQARPRAGSRVRDLLWQPQRARPRRGLVAIPTQRRSDDAGGQRALLRHAEAGTRRPQAVAGQGAQHPRLRNSRRPVRHLAVVPSCVLMFRRNCRCCSRTMRRCGRGTALLRSAVPAAATCSGTAAADFPTSSAAWPTMCPAICGANTGLRTATCSHWCRVRR